ncbi:MAG: hypothetical protein KGK00_05660 [Paracoccaceae bacterium]|nr:hypothetical protein [Paracoccaceae bacterium]
MTADQTRKAARLAAILSIAGSVLYFGLFGLLPHGGRIGDVIGILASLAAGASLYFVHRLSHLRELHVGEMLRALIETTAGAVVFLYVLYHLSHTFRFAGPVALAINALLPPPALEVVAMLPGLIALALTEAVWRMTHRREKA